MANIQLPPDPYTHRFFHIEDIDSIGIISMKYSAKRINSSEWYLCTNDATEFQISMILTIPNTVEITETQWEEASF